MEYEWASTDQGKWSIPTLRNTQFCAIEDGVNLVAGSFATDSRAGVKILFTLNFNNGSILLLHIHLHRIIIC